MKKVILSLFGILLSFLMGAISTSCEKPISDEEEQTQQTSSAKKQDGNVVLRIVNFRQVPFDVPMTRAVVDLTTYCKRLNYVVFKDGKKVDSRSQMKGDSGFGEVAMTLKEGTYNLLVLAHSSVGGNPTLTDPEKIQFTNALGYSDTFSYYGVLVVTKESKTHELTLTRNVSCLRFTINDEFPENLGFMMFDYTGGSGVLNAVTGYGGLVNSLQHKQVKMNGYTAPMTFSLYTFPQDDEINLHLTVTAYAKDSTTVIKQQQFENIPMKYQMVTEYNGDFFEHESTNGFNIKAETDWGEPFYHFDY